MYLLDDIARIINGQLSSSDPSLAVQRICHDTRRILQPKNTLFVALKGPAQDGHQYISFAKEKGINLFLISDASMIEAEAHYILVEDTLQALQKLASYHRTKTKATVLSITGSNGKTVIKEWIAHLLKDQTKIAKTPASYNSQLGVALSILECPLDAELWIIESGISKEGEMASLRKMILPDLVLVSNIGTAHNAGFKSRQEKLKEKLLLAREAKQIIYCKDHIDIDAQLSSNAKGSELISWSEQGTTAAIILFDRSESSHSIEASYKGKRFSWQCPFTDPIRLENLYHSLSIGLLLGLEIRQADLDSLPALHQRMEKLEAWRDCTVFNDSYSLDPSSLKLALEHIQSQGNHSKKSLIFSAMDEHHYATDSYSIISELISEAKIKNCIFIGPKPYLAHGSLSKLVDYHYLNVEEMISSHPFHIHQDEDILIKGARKYRLEKVANALSKKSHNTILEINLKAIEHNLAVFRSYLKPRTKLIAVIKASAYGSGDREIAHYLAKQAVDYLAVAYEDEGIQLRNQGITTPIMVLTPTITNYTIYSDYQLEPQIISMEQIHQLKNNISSPIKVHLNIDTGMSRNGISPAELEAFTDVIESSRFLTLSSVFSHLSSADDPMEDVFTRSQLSIFENCVQKLKAGVTSPFFSHILNTSGLVRFSQYQYDAVRIGLGLYGLGGNEEICLEPAHSLKSTLVNIKTLATGSSIGYNRTEKLQADQQIGIVSIGYADGLMRKCGNRRYQVYIEGTACDIIGNVSMDMIMIDLSAIDNPKTGMTVTIFDAQRPIRHLAQACDTITYEILSRIAPRVKRVIVRS